MKIIVFGATGGVGQHVVRRAAEAGHEVTAFVRTPEKLQYREGVTVRQGDAFDASAVASAIEGQDAVISCLAPSTGLKKSDELERMTANIVAGMQQGGVSRIAYCASLGVDGELDGIIGRGVQWVLRHPLADHRAALRHITDAGLDVTVARPTTLSNSEAVEYVETFTGAPAMNRAIPRASVADFLVKAVEQPQVYSRTSVGLAPLGA
ncbi:NAD(P)-binding oxidoreductase [Microbacterium sp. A84]|uniref:NAD(P)-binding oxidoreductase n=1 Tax=Microbacterium sp. A84 TaxID=3450715 RepID=UPI003F4424D2